MPSPFLAYLKESVSTFNEYAAASKQSDGSYVSGWGRDPILSEAQQKIALNFSDFVKKLESSQEGRIISDHTNYLEIKNQIKKHQSSLQRAINEHNERMRRSSYLTKYVPKTSTNLTQLFELFEKCLDYTYDIFKKHKVEDQPTEPSPLFQFRYALLRYWARKKKDQLILTEYGSSLKDYVHGCVYDWKVSADKDTEVAKFLEKTGDTWEDVKTYTVALMKIDDDIRDLDKKESAVPVGIAGITGYIPITLSKNPASLAGELKTLLRTINRMLNTDPGSARSSSTATPVNYARANQSARSATSAPGSQVTSPMPSAQIFRSAALSPPPQPVTIEEEDDEGVIEAYYSDNDDNSKNKKSFQ